MKRRDENGLPARETGKHEEKCVVMLDRETFGAFLTLKHKMERDCGRPLSRSAVLVACIHQAHKRIMESEQGTAQVAASLPAVGDHYDEPAGQHQTVAA